MGINELYSIAKEICAKNTMIKVISELTGEGLITVESYGRQKKIIRPANDVSYLVNLKKAIDKFSQQLDIALKTLKEMYDSKIINETTLVKGLSHLTGFTYDITVWLLKVSVYNKNRLLVHLLWEEFFLLFKRINKGFYKYFGRYPKILDSMDLYGKDLDKEIKALDKENWKTLNL